MTAPLNNVILLCKGDAFSAQARIVAESLFGSALTCFQGHFGDRLPNEVANASPDLLLSFLSPWIVPASLLARCGKAINFHPASRDYPGYGCYNFALYDEAPEYGGICHYMSEKVDTGAIIEERRFPVFANDTVETLKFRTLVTLLGLFHDIASRLRAGTDLPSPDLAWSRKPYTKKELNRLTELDAQMPADEIRRRVRAVTYPGFPGAKITLGGMDFYSSVPDRAALA